MQRRWIGVLGVLMSLGVITSGQAATPFCGGILKDANGRTLNVGDSIRHYGADSNPTGRDVLGQDCRIDHRRKDDNSSGYSILPKPR